MGAEDYHRRVNEINRRILALRRKRSGLLYCAEESQHLGELRELSDILKGSTDSWTFNLFKRNMRCEFNSLFKKAGMPSRHPKRTVETIYPWNSNNSKGFSFAFFGLEFMISLFFPSFFCDAADDPYFFLRRIGRSTSRFLYFLVAFIYAYNALHIENLHLIG